MDERHEVAIVSMKKGVQESPKLAVQFAWGTGEAAHTDVDISQSAMAPWLMSRKHRENVSRSLGTRDPLNWPGTVPITDFS